MPDQTLSNNTSQKVTTESILANQSILDVFVLQGILDPHDADSLKGHFKTNREAEDFLIKNHLVTRDTINKAYSILLKIPYISFRNVSVPYEALSIIPEKLAKKYSVAAFSLNGRLLRIAVTRPADLLAKYPEGLQKLFRDNGFAVELFITGDEDLAEVFKQYDQKRKQSFLVRRGSLPVIFLRNQIVPDKYLKRLPENFIARYRMVVFNQNAAGQYQIACELPDSAVTSKVIEYLRQENGIQVELFATSKEDIDYAMQLYEGISNRPKMDLGIKKIDKSLSGPTEEKTTVEVEKPKEDGQNKSLRELLNSLISQNNGPEFTVDEKPDLQSFGEPVGAAGRVLEQKPENKMAASAVVSEPKNEASITTVKVAAPVSETEKPAEDKPPESPELEKPVSAPAELVKPDHVVQKEEEGEAGQSIAKRKDLEEKNLGLILGNKEIATSEDLENIIATGYVPKMLAAILALALSQRASDIHIEPGPKTMRVRYRVDGLLRDVARIPLEYHPPLTSRLKILTQLKIDETRVPQDGRFELVYHDREVDVRVSLLPTINGEKLVMRLLDKDQGILSLEDLGMQGSAFDKTVAAIEKPYGIILSTGPTGSGKSTTLYAAINRLSVPGVNIVTLEDPVEYEISGINQCQIKPEIGFTFAAGLRSVLRQDPNVIMVGEIRDAETANMATHAALTGHLVLSTLHTNDTAGALPRLTNMGVEPFLITSSINLVIAQRLVRRICVKCKEEMKVPPKFLEEIRAEISKISTKNVKDLARIPKEMKFYYGKGCNHCTAGFRGRVGIFEVMDVNPKIEELAVARRPANEIKAVSLQEGMITMKQDGIMKALEGITTIDEVFQATSSD